MPEFKLPDVGEGLTEAEIVTWKVKVGDTVTINDIVVEIETAKSLVELPSPFAGIVQRAAGRPRARPSRSARRSSRSATDAAAERGAAPATPEPPRRRAARSTCPNPAASRRRPRASRLVGRAEGRPRAPYAGRATPPSRLAGGAAAQQQLQALLRARARLAGGRGRRTRRAVPCPRPRADRVSPAAARALAKPPVRKLAKDLGVDLADARRRPGRTARSPATTSQAAQRRRRVDGRGRASDEPRCRRRAARGRPATRSRASAR